MSNESSIQSRVKKKHLIISNSFAKIMGNFRINNNNNRVQQRERDCACWNNNEV